MKPSIRKFQLAGRRPRSVANRAPVTSRQQANPESRDIDPSISWQKDTPVAWTAIAAPANTMQHEPAPLTPIEHWVRQAPPGHRQSYRKLAEHIKACAASGARSLAVRCPVVTSLPPLPGTLIRLDISADSLTIAPDLSGCVALTSLAIRHCPRLTTAPDVTACPALATLTILGCPGLTTAPDVSGCPALTTVEIQHCDSLAVVPDIAGCPALRTLVISVCPSLTTAPNVSACPALTSLTIFGGRSLTAAPQISGCPALTTLNMRACPLTSLPEDILGLARNCIVEISADHLSETVRQRLATNMAGPGYAGPWIRLTTGSPELVAAAG